MRFMTLIPRSALIVAASLAAIGTFPGAISPAHAEGSVNFSATVDKQEIPQDESISLKLTVEIEGASLSVGEPEFRSPGLEELNSYQNQFFQSYYENGKFGARNTRTVTKVLRASRPGNYTISGIQIRVNGQAYTAPNITVKVTPPGQGTPTPRNYGGGMGLRGTGKRYSGVNFLLRAETSKAKPYKGEQIIVSYYLYKKVNLFNPVVKSYPTLNGFLREELEMPIVSGMSQGQQVVMDGVPYVRTLLLRYAAYPLKEGKLTIDSLQMNANYYVNERGGEDDEDMFNQFFRQLTPKVAHMRSEPVTVEVQPLPPGKPASFTGGVGNFDVVSAVDKYDTKVNEPVTLTVKVEGKGNVSAIEAPNPRWPDSIQLYESKGQAKTGSGGVGQKVFEFLLIPSQEGKIALPPLEFSFFDPERQEYVTKSTQAIEINAGPAAPGSQPVGVASKRPSAPGAGKVADTQWKDIRYLKPPGSETSGFYGLPFWRWTYWLATAAFLAFFAWVGWDLLQKNRGFIPALARTTKRAGASDGSWKALQDLAVSARGGMAWKDVTRAYESLSNALLDRIEAKYPVGARSLARSDLRRLLVDENRMNEALWRRISTLLETAEAIQYAGSMPGMEKQAREQLTQWVSEAERISSAL